MAEEKPGPATPKDRASPPGASPARKLLESAHASLHETRARSKLARAIILRSRARAAALNWIGTYGPEAPEQIRRWSRDLSTGAEAAAFLELVAKAAERALAERRRKG